MRDYSQPFSDFWIHAQGKRWKTPQNLVYLKMKIPSYRAFREFIIQCDDACVWCGVAENFVADHIVSRRNGGIHHSSNLQTLCAPCNARKAELVDAKRGIHG